MRPDFITGMVLHHPYVERRTKETFTRSLYFNGLKTRDTSYITDIQNWLEQLISHGENVKFSHGADADTDLDTLHKN